MTGWPGKLALGLVLALIVGAFAAVLRRADGFGALTPADWSALRFTLLQAGLSAVLSVLAAIPLARALARRRFRGRGVAIALLGAPFILPVIVVVMGLIALFGRAGLINAGLGLLGLPSLSIYGLAGILTAHLFLNMPLAVRMILNGWAAIPGERFRTAEALDLGPGQMFRLIEWPMLRATLPGAAMAIFLVCLSSFTVVLVMGGGPGAATLELAIYQAFRLDFDLGHAASLAALQMAVSLAAALVGLRMTAGSAFGAGLGRLQAVPVPTGRGRMWCDGLAIGLAATFLGLPILLILVRGVPGLAALPASVWPSALRSVAVALAATAMAVSMALAIGLLAVSRAGWRARLIDALAMLALAGSPLVLGTGLFLILRPLADPVAAALPLTAVVNGVMALPFCLRLLMPGLVQTMTDYGRLADSLGLTGWGRLRHLVLPRLRQPLGLAAGLAAALAMGDLGVIALFADPARATLPMQIYGLMGAYRMDQAAGAAILLMVLSFGLFLAFDLMGRRDADT